jgi:hypothetical protein
MHNQFRNFLAADAGDLIVNCIQFVVGMGIVYGFYEFGRWHEREDPTAPAK